MYRVTIQNNLDKEELKTSLKYKIHIYFDDEEDALKYVEIQKQTSIEVEKAEDRYKYIDPIDNTKKIITIKKIYKYDLIPKLEKNEIAICQQEGKSIPKVVIIEFENRNLAKKFLKIQVEGKDLYQVEYEDNILYKNKRNEIKYAIKNNTKLKDVDKIISLLTMERFITLAKREKYEIYQGENSLDNFYIIISDKKLTFANVKGRKYVILYTKYEKELGEWRDVQYCKLTDSLKTVKKFAEQYKCPDFLEDYK